jgi:4-hydroxybenzoate polyprenyltransferase
MVDREDDLKIGIRSSAIFFGRYDVLAIMVCFAAMLGILTYVGMFMRFGLFYYAGLLLALLLMMHQYWLIKKRLKAECFKAFLWNSWIGGAITLGLWLDLVFYKASHLLF